MAWGLECRACSLTDVLNLAALESCTRCALAASRQRVVVGSGPAAASLVVVGEAPGRNEDEGGEPFVGRSGQLLTRLIADELHLERADYFITNAVKCRPPANRTPTRHELTTCRAWLDEQLAAFPDALVLAVGNTAGRALFGYRGSLASVRGRIFRSDQVRGLVTFHPAAALRGGPSVVAMMREDLRRVATLWETR